MVTSSQGEAYVAFITAERSLTMVETIGRAIEILSDNDGQGRVVDDMRSQDMLRLAELAQLSVEFRFC